LISDNYLSATVGMSFIHPVNTTISKLSVKEKISKEEAIQKINALRTIAMSKRMVIFGATIHPFIQSKIDGIPNNYNIAVVDDLNTLLFNLQGNTVNQDQHDGGIFMLPWVAKWESNSIPELEQSDVHRKPIGYVSRNNYLASELLKTATYSFTNE
jgi:hypothetical protein